MTSYLADLALLPDGWARDVLLEVDRDGNLVTVRPAAGVAGPAAPPPPLQRISGAVLPGVPNLHSHAFQRAMAGLAERGSAAGDTFWTWRERMYDFLQNLQPDDVESVASLVFMEMLKSGFTAVAEFHYLHHDPRGRPYDDPAEMSLRILAAARATGIGLTHLPALYVAGDFGGAPIGAGQRRFVLDADGALELVGRVRDAAAEEGQLRAGLALHSLRAVPPEAMRAALDGLGSLDPEMPVHIHVAEQEREVEACVAWSGARPVEWLLDHEPVSPRWCAVHATHMTPAETRALAGSGAVAGLCPTTEANLGDGVFPLAPYLEAGGALGVGSDSQVSVSPREELRLLEYGQRLLHRRRNVAAGAREVSTGAVLFKAALEGGARAVGRPVGRLETGRRADLVVLDARHPSLAGRDGDALLDSWIFAGGEGVVRDVMVGGRWVVRDGQHVSEEEVARRYREVVRRWSLGRGEAGV